jgi:hypothetical protein
MLEEGLGIFLLGGFGIGGGFLEEGLKLVEVVRTLGLVFEAEGLELGLKGRGMGEEGFVRVLELGDGELVVFEGIRARWRREVEGRDKLLDISYTA